MPAPLAVAFGSRLHALGLEPGAPLLVALSGGLDSVVMLHLARFRSGHPVTAAHLDHRMRTGSDADARWTRGLCAAWQVPLELRAAEPPPRGEAPARQLRYAFLREAAERVGARAILTAHHADDQAETVLFNAARGSGIRGLRGVLEREGQLVRPLLPWTRDELERYARGCGLRWREDPTNATLGPRRNRLRQRILPLLEAEVAPGARRNLARLAGIAAERERALAALLAPWLERALVERGAELVLRRGPFRELPPPAAAELLRAALESAGWRLGAAGTRSAVTFITDASGGRALRPGAGLELLSEYDQVRVRRLSAEGDRELRIEKAAEGGGEVLLGGHAMRLRWSPAGDGERVTLALPARVRAWQPGDTLMRGGLPLSLREHFRRNRIPRALRARTPVLEDASGELRWCRGVGAADDPLDARSVLYIHASDD